jgi:hypothetical protein
MYNLQPQHLSHTPSNIITPQANNVSTITTTNIKNK